MKAGHMGPNWTSQTPLLRAKIRGFDKGETSPGKSPTKLEAPRESIRSTEKSLMASDQNVTEDE